MLVVGLTGGIGSGKSTFAALLAERGARVLDADLMAREALRPGAPAWHSVVDTFGTEILAAGSMEIDRARLARIVFSDSSKLAALNAIVHPVISKRIADELERLADTDAVVVVDAALVVEAGLDRVCDLLLVVHAPPEVRKRRLADARGMSAEDIGARMASQMDPATLMESADIVVPNQGNLESLQAEADRVWEELTRRRSA